MIDQWYYLCQLTSHFYRNYPLLRAIRYCPIEYWYYLTCWSISQCYVNFPHLMSNVDNRLLVLSRKVGWCHNVMQTTHISFLMGSLPLPVPRPPTTPSLHPSFSVQLIELNVTVQTILNLCVSFSLISSCWSKLKSVVIRYDWLICDLWSNHIESVEVIILGVIFS